MFTYIHELSAVKKFKKLGPEFHEIAFYSEGASDWPHIGPLIDSLLHRENKKVSFFTSEASDPGLKLDHPSFRAFLIGAGMVRTILFRKINVKKFVMTLPDLQTFHLKRSVHPVHYVYVFHSTNSTHSGYRKGAFDGFDTVLCVGAHHVEEIRKTEKFYNLKHKNLLPQGSCKIDTILRECSARNTACSDKKIILVAPSWGDSSLAERPEGLVVIEALLKTGYQVVLRPHPMTLRRLPKLLEQIREKFVGHDFALESDMNATQSWIRSDLMVSDWSGAASEYSFATLKPVVYVDMPQKLNNPEWEKVGLRPFEDSIRFEIGMVLPLEKILEISEAVKKCLAEKDLFQEKIKRARERAVFNIGRSADVGAKIIADL